MHRSARQTPATITISHWSSGSPRFPLTSGWPNWIRESHSSGQSVLTMTPSFREILQVLNKYEVDYIVVGGVAAVIHGAPITTFDLDTLVRVNTVNAGRLLQALTALEARFREHQAHLTPTQQDILAGGHMLLMTRAGPLDVLGYIGDGQRYEELVTASSEVAMDVGAIRVLDLDELIRQKKVLGRTKDRAVAGLLEEVLRRGSK
jgi:hypothetical protein